jgi:photosystem I P700 chlorophyll a apoprotein A2
MATKFPKFSQDLAQDPTTRRIWYGIATAHDFELHDGMTEENLYQKIFASHFGHIAIIFLWTSGTLFHVAWQGNFEQWIKDPLNVRPIAHAIWDPQFGQGAVDAFTQAGAANPVNICYSGVYHWFYTIGMRTNDELHGGAMFLLLLAAIFLFAGWLHLQPKFRPSLSWFKNAESRLNHHLAGLFGVSSLAWTGHLVHVAIPESRGIHVGWNNFLSVKPHPAGLAPFFTGNWGAYAQNPDTANHIFGTSEGAGTAILTFLGGFHPQTESLWLTDMAHHHLAIAVIFIIAGHMYRTNFGLGHSIEAILEAHKPPSGKLGEGHKGMYDTLNNSLHFQLALALASLGVITSLVAQHMYSMPPYAFIARDYTTQAALYTHHQYIAGFLMVGAFAHGAIFLIRDYDPEANKNNVLYRVLEHKEAIISHLSWVSLFLGFHTLGLYVHNDVVVAFGTPEKQILIEPVFAQWIQAAHGKALYGFDVLLSNPDSIASTAYPNYGNVWLPGWLDAINSGANSLFLTIGPGDFLVHHAIALGLHTTTLILVKGALDARGSKLMPDKKDFGYSFPCDGSWPWRYLRHLCLGFLLPRHVLDAEHLRLADVLLALETPRHLARKCCPIQRKFDLLNGLVPRLPLGKLRTIDQRLQPVWHEQPLGLGLDVLIRTPGLGDRLHVLDLLARLLARVDRNDCLGARTHAAGEPGSLERQARGSVYRSSSLGWFSSLHRWLRPNLCSIRNCFDRRQVRLIPANG